MDNEGDMFRRCERAGRLFAALFLSSGWKPIVNIFGKKKVANYQACAMLSVALRSVNPYRLSPSMLKNSRQVVCNSFHYYYLQCLVNILQ